MERDALTIGHLKDLYFCYGFGKAYLDDLFNPARIDILKERIEIDCRNVQNRQVLEVLNNELFFVQSL